MHVLDNPSLNKIHISNVNVIDTHILWTSSWTSKRHVVGVTFAHDRLCRTTSIRHLILLLLMSLLLLDTHKATADSGVHP